MEGSTVLNRHGAVRPRRAAPRPPFVQRYWAFLSYSHADAADADWLHKALEKFRVPPELVGRRAERFLVPRTVTPIFRDRSELAASSDLDTEIHEAIECSRHLIVLCSPAAARSRWVNEEIRTFKRLRPDGEVLAAIVGGEPHAGDPDQECLPPALTQKLDARGRPTGEPAEPIATDLRASGDGRETGLLKLVAGMLDLRLDELVHRNERQRQRRWAVVSSGAVAGMLLTTGLAVTAIQARDEAQAQRREAEGLVGFMIGDLKDKLEPVGRLDALDAVGGKVLAYYGRQNKGDLSDESLAQRAKALTLMGDIAQRRGKLDAALGLYREATGTTSELLRRYPNDPKRVYDHAQNLFFFGSVAWQRGRLADTGAAFRGYRALADRMMQLDPGNPTYQLESVYADHNLGVFLIQAEERFPEAAALFSGKVVPLSRMVAAKPQDLDLAKQLMETLAFLADAEAGQGRYREAIAARGRELALAERYMLDFPGDSEFRVKAMVGHGALARLLLATGDADRALGEVRTGLKLANEVTASGPDNTQWAERAALVHLSAGDVLLARGELEAAAVEARIARDVVDELIAKDPTAVRWSEELRRRCLLLEMRGEFARGGAGTTLVLADQIIANVHASRLATPRRGFDLALAQLFAGQALTRLGRPNDAAQRWQAALAQWPLRPTAMPEDLAVRTVLLRRTGQGAEAQALAGRLARIGYRHPLYVRAMQEGA